MSMGRKSEERQAELFIMADQLPKSVGHVFYRKLNQLLAEAGFDPWVENLCEPFYAKKGRPSVPPGTYFRMLLVGYFEGIQSQRGIAWRCADSLSLREFLSKLQTHINGILPREGAGAMLSNVELLFGSILAERDSDQGGLLQEWQTFLRILLGREGVHATLQCGIQQLLLMVRADAAT